MNRLLTGIRSLTWLIVMFTFVIYCSGCFVRNCPPGGKRGLADNSYAIRECMLCMDNRGTCVGPNICCGASIGCHIGTKQAEECAKENDSTTPCQVPGKTCGPEGEGNCVADGICCTSDACALDNSCKQKGMSVQQRRDELVELLKRVLESKRLSLNQRD
ncbi:terepressin/terephysin-like [Tubulanus polymorphus]|uniref:terepressin/terephysin-like n=1 Tax=Tubulanus polymorphus TaxID=672921 RepID=UPI003DA61995